jgi:hypothetical protein
VLQARRSLTSATSCEKMFIAYLDSVPAAVRCLRGLFLRGF